MKILFAYKKVNYILFLSLIVKKIKNQLVQNYLMKQMKKQKKEINLMILYILLLS